MKDRWKKWKYNNSITISLVAVATLPFLLDIDDTYDELFDFPADALCFRQKGICGKVVVHTFEGPNWAMRVTVSSPLMFLSLSLSFLSLSPHPFSFLSHFSVSLSPSPRFVSLLSLSAAGETNREDKKQPQTMQKEPGRRTHQRTHHCHCLFPPHTFNFSTTVFKKISFFQSQMNLRQSSIADDFSGRHSKTYSSVKLQWRILWHFDNLTSLIGERTRKKMHCSTSDIQPSKTRRA